MLLKYSKTLNIYKTNIGITALATDLTGFNSKVVFFKILKIYKKKTRNK